MRRQPIERQLLRGGLAGLLACGSCAPSTTGHLEGIGQDVQREPTLRFAYTAIDGRQVATPSLAGRVSVLGFFASFDLPSQLEARVLSSLERHHAPRINIAVLMVEARENQPLVEVFARSVGLTCPIAIVSEASIAGRAVFAGIQGVPSVVILDRHGRASWHHTGFVSERALDEAVVPWLALHRRVQPRFAAWRGTTSQLPPLQEEGRSRTPLVRSAPCATARIARR